MIKPGPFGTRNFSFRTDLVFASPAARAEPVVTPEQVGSIVPGGSYGNRPEPIPFLHILAVSDREDVRGEHGPLT